MAVTRARRHLAVVCDTQTVQTHAFLKSLINHMTEYGEVRTAFEYLQDIVPQNYTRDHKDTKANDTANSRPSTKYKVKGQPTDKAEPVQKKPTGSKSKEDNTHLDKPAKSCTSATSALTEEEQTKNKYTEIREKVESFLKDPNQTELQFPSSFNSHDRLLVHQISEELGLGHESRGEGKDRCIYVSRPLQSGQTEEATAERPTEQAEERVLEPQEKPPCQPATDLKSLHLERMKREQQKREENAQLKKQQDSIRTGQAQSSKKTKSAKG